MQKKTSEPIAVLISDIHFNIKNLEIATKALLFAFEKAYELNTRLIICGDLNDTKSIIRGEVANRLIDIFKEWSYNIKDPYILVGNHDRLNEAAKPHSLNFLLPWACVIDRPFAQNPFYLIPYCSTNEEFREAISYANKDDIIITHQGYKGAFMGDYVQDRSSVDPEELKTLTIFSGHYHKHQKIGPVTYVGSPYTTSFGEANDGPKGILVVYEDKSFEQIPLNLPKHVIIDLNTKNIFDDLVLKKVNLLQDDRVWVKINGNTEDLRKIKKEDIALALGKKDFKLDLIPEDEEKPEIDIVDKTNEQLVDELIDNLKIAPSNKIELKQLWRELINEDT